MRFCCSYKWRRMRFKGVTLNFWLPPFFLSISRPVWLRKFTFFFSIFKLLLKKLWFSSSISIEKKKKNFFSMIRFSFFFLFSLSISIMAWVFQLKSISYLNYSFFFIFWWLDNFSIFFFYSFFKYFFFNFFLQSNESNDSKYFLWTKTFGIDLFNEKKKKKESGIKISNR